ncbi:MAG: SpaA isopeptide-forming pilin-related protein [Lachnospiraceae bacterium]|nr:SpaA isopeptide-forming pilin-related protein [Lachnospiraceae bacterium]
MKRNLLTKMLSATMAAAVALTPMVSMSVYAATSDVTTNNTATANDLANADIIDMSKTGSLSIYKYDMAAAKAAQAYNEGDRIATGQQDAEVERIMSDYAIEGVQFTYLRAGNIETYSYTGGVDSQINVVYEIPTALADILGLTAADAYDMKAAGVAEPCAKTGVYHYDSTQLTDALDALLKKDDVAAKNALETYLYSYGTMDSTTDQHTNVGAVNMPKTDAKGYTHVDGLELGLYLIVETEVPEQVVETVNPWFASLPFTNISSDEVDNGGDYWLYDMTCYPKNQTGNPTLDKSVRNAYSNTGATDDKNGTVNSGDKYDSKMDSSSLVVYNKDTNAENTADTNDAAYVANRGGYTTDGVTAGAGGAGYSTDFEYRDTTTASAGDILDYILVSRLPHISSKSTFLSEYTFTDILSAGLTYNKDVKIAFYDNATDANVNNTKNAVLLWNLGTGSYEQKYATANITNWDTGATDGSTQLTVSLTEAGLSVINGTGTNNPESATDLNGLSDYYMVVYYTATVNSNETLVLGDNGNENDVVLTWSRTSDGFYNTMEDRNYVYAYSLDLTKEFSDDKGDFSQVEFKLYNTTDAYYVEAKFDEAAGVYYVTGKNVDEDAATTFVPTDDGSIVVYGLEADTYQITEIATDNGYTLLKDQIVVTITPTDREVIASVAGVTGMDADAVDAIVQYYHGGIYDENGNLVNATKDALTGADANRPALQTANGRTIGKTDMYVGAIIPAAATVDKVDAEMASHVYKEGNSNTQLTSADATVLLNVVNNANFVLPNTGGYGTLVFTLAACAVAFAGIIILTKKPKEKNA